MYTQTQWKEAGMTTQQKVDALNNLETIYSNAVYEIDAILHEDRYYTKTAANSKYFTPYTDGEGSGMVCERLDGYTAQQILDAGTPSGCIGIWYGLIGNIPSGWALCDGLNGTPDLRDRFVVGAGKNYSVYDVGGSNVVTTTASITIGSHALTAEEIPKHTHGTITDYWTQSGSCRGGFGSASSSSYQDQTKYTASTGGGAGHSHAASFSGTQNQDKRPPFYTLAYIMKL
jgi:microcystin-dependent protein